MVKVELHNGKSITAFGLVNHTDIASFFNDVNADNLDQFNERVKLIRKSFSNYFFYIVFNKQGNIEVQCLNIDADNDAELLEVISYVVTRMED